MLLLETSSLVMERRADSYVYVWGEKRDILTQYSHVEVIFTYPEANACSLSQVCLGTALEVVPAH